MTTTAAALFERHHLAVYRYLRRMTGSRDVAQDLTQDVFMRVVERLYRYEEQGRETAWLFAIVRHVLAEYYHKREPERADVAEAASIAIESNQIAAFGFSEALALLPKTEREMFLLRELAGLSYVEIAAVTGATEEAVRSRLYRARRQIRHLLSARLSLERPDVRYRDI